MLTGPLGDSYICDDRGIVYPSILACILLARLPGIECELYIRSVRLQLPSELRE